MKKLIIIPLLALATSANAGMWDKAVSLTNKDVQPSTEYNVDTSGWNIRIYEFIPAENPNWRCVIAAGEKKGGIACYPAKIKEIK